MDSSLGIKLVEQPQQQNHHQQQTVQQAQQHPHNNNNINNNNITNNTGGVVSGDDTGGSNTNLQNHARINATFPNPIKRPPPQPQDPSSSNKNLTNFVSHTKQNNTQRNQSAPTNNPPPKTLIKLSTTATKNAATRKIEICEKNDVGGTLTTEDVDSFFARGLHNSCQATDGLIKSIEESQDESLARRALNHYQCHYSTLERPWEHETLMYGLGLIYMHFNAYNWAIKSLRDTVYVKPGFPKSRDIHTRLGLIFKTTGRYRLSKKHFNLAIHDTRKDSGMSTKQELRFHLAHLAELQGETKRAIELYEELLQEKNLPDKLSANIHRHLGWIHYSTTISANSANKKNEPKSNIRRPSQDNIFGQASLIEPRKLDTALNHLRTSDKTDNDSQTSYYLGRCLTNIGRFQDAFACYRSVIDKEESTADTWCSIGVLYQRQNQPWDALQAYIRSVQYDKKHSVAWMNLGILYETHHQFKDALKCYRHILRSNSVSRHDTALQARINYIQKHLTDMEASSSNSSKPDISSDKLLSLEDLWNMESKTNQESYLSSTSNINRTDSSHHRRNATAQSQIKLALTDHTLNQPKALNDMTTPMEVDHPRLCNGQIVDQNNHRIPINETSHGVNPKNSSPKESAIHSEAIHSNLNQSNQIHHDSGVPTKNHLNGLQISSSNDCKSLVATQTSHDVKPLLLDSKDTCLNQLFSNGTSKDSGISSDSSTYADCALVPSQSTDISTASYISAERVLETCGEISTTKLKKLDVNLLSDDSKLPTTCPRTPMYPPPRENALLPLPPSIFLDSKRELASKKLQDICLSNPISIVRNMANVLKLDLGLFSTRTLVESNPDQQIDIIGHLFSQDSDSSVNNNDDELTNPWVCERHQSTSTISRFASYQVSSFRQSLQDERDSKSKSHLIKESETDSNESSTNKKNNTDGPSSSKQTDTPAANSKSSLVGRTKPKKDCPKTKYVKSANMIDLSDDKKWRPQLHELNKLPHFMKCVSASNMLTHIGSAVPGLNTITMSMHVPGCRVVSNRRPNQYCSIYINTGPGDYEWCAISSEYEGVLRKVCNRNGLDLDQNDWWPLLSDLHKYRIPVYRFTQRPGDLVWLNSSTLFWVQATGWANIIQWNLVPLSSRQYQLASESCELDKLLLRRSEIPMVQMTWNIIINISIITDDDLFWSMVNVLRRSLLYCKLVRDLIKESNHSVKQSDDEPGPRSAKYCSLCEFEIFNITFAPKQQDKLSVHCVECARRVDATFNSYTIRQEYELKYLMKIYDNFIEMKKKFQMKQMQTRTKQ